MPLAQSLCYSKEDFHANEWKKSVYVLDQVLALIMQSQGQLIWLFPIQFWACGIHYSSSYILSNTRIQNAEIKQKCQIQAKLLIDKGTRSDCKSWYRCRGPKGAHRSLNLTWIDTIWHLDQLVRLLIQYIHCSRLRRLQCDSFHQCIVSLKIGSY